MRVYPSERRVDPLNLTVEDIELCDIARALSRLCRYNGHVHGYISVARHAVWVAELLLDAGEDPQRALEGLHHDDTEAYLGDMIRPLKHGELGGIFRDAEERADLVIAEKFALSFPQHPIVTEADRVAQHLELEYRRETFWSDPESDELDWLTAHDAINHMIHADWDSTPKGKHTLLALRYGHGPGELN